MKQEFLVDNNANTVLLFFGGWGSEPNLFSGLRSANPNYFGEIENAKNCDIMLCYDYTTLDFDASPLEKYQHILVQGWSMGVWVAQHVLGRFPKVQKKVQHTVAINGTPTPINNQEGIPVEIFSKTLSNFNAQTLARFRRRMCGGSNQVAEFLALSPRRTLESLQVELSALKNFIEKFPTTNFIWSLAIISTQDKIFPHQNQLQSWSKNTKKYLEIDAEHFWLSIF